MPVRTSGIVSSTSRCHLPTKWGGQSTRTRLEAGQLGGGDGDERLAHAHLADHGRAALLGEAQRGAAVCSSRSSMATTSSNLGETG